MSSRGKLGSIFTPYEYYYAWNKANDKDTVANGISSLMTMIKGAFAKDRVLKLLRDFVFYPDDSKKNEAIVCRYSLKSSFAVFIAGLLSDSGTNVGLPGGL